MKKRSKSAAARPRVDPYLEGLMAKLLERLLSLEKKMDTVIARTGKSSASPGQAVSPQNPAPPGSPRGDRTLYEAICADCHKVCEVPFRPSEDRAVYCKECFARRKSGGSKPFAVLTPVALPPKPLGKLHLPASSLSALGAKPQKAKKTRPVKKTKKKK